MENIKDSTSNAFIARPRLLFVVNVSWFFVSHRIVLAKAAIDAGYEVHVATRVENATDAELICQAGITLHHIEIGRGDTGLIYDLRSIFELFRLYRSVDADIIHHVAMKPVVYGGIVARIGNRAYVQAIPGLGYTFFYNDLRSSIRRKLVVWGLRVACKGNRAMVIVQNVENLNILLEQNVATQHGSVLIRGSGVDVAAVKVCPEPSGPVRVVFAARMLREKGLEEFVEAARQLKAMGIEAEFLLAGDPDPANPGSVDDATLRDWDEEGVVRYLGYVDDVIRLFADSHIVCLPSYGEGVPRVLIEAAATERAVITTNTPGCRDIVRDGVNGLLVPPRDVASLVTALRKLIEDKTLRRSFGEAGRKLASDEFDLKIVVQQTLDVYTGLLQSQGRGL